MIVSRLILPGSSVLSVASLVRISSAVVGRGQRLLKPGEQISQILRRQLLDNVVGHQRIRRFAQASRSGCRGSRSRSFLAVNSVKLLASCSTIKPDRTRPSLVCDGVARVFLAHDRARDRRCSRAENRDRGGWRASGRARSFHLRRTAAWHVPHCLRKTSCPGCGHVRPPRGGRCSSGARRPIAPRRLAACTAPRYLRTRASRAPGRHAKRPRATGRPAPPADRLRRGPRDRTMPGPGRFANSTSRA